MRRLRRARLTLVFAVLAVAVVLSACGRQSEPTATAVPLAATALPATATPRPTATAAPTPTTAAVDPPAPSSPLAPPASPLAAPASPLTAPAGVPVYTYRVVAEYPHDPDAYTQGLVYVDGQLFEGTGLNGGSSLRRVDLATGQVEQMVTLQDEFFGEGIAVRDDEIVQLTWHSNVGIVFDRESFEVRRVVPYPTKGWGLTHDGQRFIMSDGTSTLYFRDSQTLEETGRVTVTAGGAPVEKLNELEYIDGEVYANVWLTDYVARVDPATGQVTGWIDLSGLQPASVTHPDGVLNGIAYDAENGRLFVTGKLWPVLYEIELVAQD